MQMKEIEVFSDCHDLLGESPRWHPNENRLYWVDIEAGTIHSQSAKEKTPITHMVNLKIGCLAFESTGSLLLATSKGIQRWNADRSVLTLLADPEAGKADARFNDGLVDAVGRFWAGTMTENDASSTLYCLEADLHLRSMVTGVTISNGIGWNTENNLMYFTDTMKRIIWQYDFDLETGTLANQRTYLEFTGEGVPDGLAVDTDGNLWIVICNGGRIQVHDPDPLHYGLHFRWSGTLRSICDFLTIIIKAGRTIPGHPGRTCFPACHMFTRPTGPFFWLTPYERIIH
jgi:sugar lactone lactonase YvrE